MTPELGIIEGYFGRCWTHDERCDVISRLAPAGYRFFHYAPKIDTFLRRDWQWQVAVRELATPKSVPTSRKRVVFRER